jgi:ornithine--oxo-acid transaminase
LVAPLKIAHLKGNEIADYSKAKPTHQNIIRLAPPLVITEEEIGRAISIIKTSMEELPTLKGKEEGDIIPQPEKDVEIRS